MSESYDKNSANLQAELYYIQEMNGGVRINLKPDDIKSILEKEGIPAGPNRDVLGLSYALAKDCIEKEEWQGAEYSLEIFYDLTEDEQTGKTLDAIRKMNIASNGN